MVRDVRRDTRLRLRSDQAVEQMTPMQILERYLELRRVPREHIATLMEYAQQLVSRS